MALDERTRAALRELGNALNEAVSSSARVHEILQRIREEGQRAVPRPRRDGRAREARAGGPRRRSPPSAAGDPARREETRGGELQDRREGPPLPPLGRHRPDARAPRAAGPAPARDDGHAPLDRRETDPEARARLLGLSLPGARAGDRPRRARAVPRRAGPALDDGAPRRRLRRDDGPPGVASAPRSRSASRSGSRRSRRGRRPRTARRSSSSVSRTARRWRRSTSPRPAGTGLRERRARDGLRLLAGGVRRELRLLRDGAARRGAEPDGGRDPRPVPRRRAREGLRPARGERRLHGDGRAAPERGERLPRARPPRGRGLAAEDDRLDGGRRSRDPRARAKRERRPNLAVSLTAAGNALRTRLMPINAQWPVAELFAALEEWPLEPGRRITFEVVLIAGVNDSPAEARALARLVKRVPSKVNLIPLNESAEWLPGLSRPSRGARRRVREPPRLLGRRRHRPLVEGARRGGGVRTAEGTRDARPAPAHSVAVRAILRRLRNQEVPMSRTIPYDPRHRPRPRPLRAGRPVAQQAAPAPTPGPRRPRAPPTPSEIARGAGKEARRLPGEGGADRPRAPRLPGRPRTPTSRSPSGASSSRRRSTTSRRPSCARPPEAAPADARVPLWLGETLLRARKTADADASFRKAAELAAQGARRAGPTTPARFLVQGSALSRLRRYDEAMVALGKARDLDGGRAGDALPDGLDARLPAEVDRRRDAPDPDRSRRTRGWRSPTTTAALSQEKLGRKDLMIVDLDRFVKVAPTAPEADRARALLAAAAR